MKRFDIFSQIKKTPVLQSPAASSCCPPGFFKEKQGYRYEFIDQIAAVNQSATSGKGGYG